MRCESLNPVRRQCGSETRRERGHVGPQEREGPPEDAKERTARLGAPGIWIRKSEPLHFGFALCLGRLLVLVAGPIAVCIIP